MDGQGFYRALRSLLALACLGLSLATSAKNSTLLSEAPRDGSATAGNWASGVKQIFGTAYESYDSKLRYSADSSTAPISKVWFTGSDGLLSEIYWPTLDTPQTRDTEIFVSDGKTFLSGERKQPAVKIEWLAPGIPAFRVVQTDAKGRFAFEKTIFTDPDRNVVMMKLKIHRYMSGLHFYVLHKPAVHNTPMGDSARVVFENGVRTLEASELGHAQSLVSSTGFKRASAAFVGPYDGFMDLWENFVMEHAFDFAENGNVNLLGELELNDTAARTKEVCLALGFGDSPVVARAEARESLADGCDSRLQKYMSQWPEYFHSLQDLSAQSGDHGVLFKSSLALIKSMEDKTYEGAFVASPSIPWGINRRDWSDVRTSPRAYLTGGYHLVWPRDLYMMATTLMAVDDFKGAIASLNRLRAVQFSPGSGMWEFGSIKRSRDGSFPQNFWMDGMPYWDSLQLDEVSMPIVLAFRLWKKKQIQLPEYWNMVLRAADFIVDVGPWSAQERWEELPGLSTSTLAAEITALRVASLMAAEMGDENRKVRYHNLADSWSAQIEKWLFTSSGQYGDGKYFERIEGVSGIEQPWDPNDHGIFPNDRLIGGRLEKNIIDGGFLEFVRFGVRPAQSLSILDSIPEYDLTLRTDVEGFGPGFKRYIGDGYNQDEETGAPRPGMLWPLLTGERGHFELALAGERGLGRADIYSRVKPYLSAIENFATPTHMIPEQVWDVGEARGKPTGAATPLGWAHGEYIKLLRSLRDGKVFDRLPEASN